MDLNNHYSNSRPQLQVDYYTMIVESENLNFRLKMFDTSKMEQLSMTYYFLRGAQGIILMFDLSNRDSFRNIDKWFREC